MPKVYVAGPITGAGEDVLHWHTKLGMAFRRRGWDTYVPHLDEEFSDERVFRHDLKEMAESDILVASLFSPSTGTGIELALFQGQALILYDEELSPMVEGLASARGWSIMQPFNDPVRVVNMAEWLIGGQDECMP